MPKQTKAQKDLATTQEHIPIATVRDGIVVLKNGGLRVILLVGAVNFSLKSEEEQNSIIFQYQSFINSLTFPIQILVQSRIMDLTSYLRSLNEELKNQTNDLLIDMTESYIDFVSNLIQDASIMNKRFYVIVPVNPISIAPKGKVRIANLSGKKTQDVTYSDKDFEHYRQQLLEHAQTVAGGLSAIGLQVAVLNTQQVVELLYTSYNPEEGLTEKLTDVDDLQENIIKEDPAIIQQQQIENIFKQRIQNIEKDNQNQNETEVSLNLKKQNPPMLDDATQSTTTEQAPETVPTKETENTQTQVQDRSESQPPTYQDPASSHVPQPQNIIPQPTDITPTSALEAQTQINEAPVNPAPSNQNQINPQTNQQTNPN